MSGYPVGHAALPVAVAVLKLAMDDCIVAARIPRVIPNKFVKVARVGGARDLIVTDRVRLLVELWAYSLGDNAIVVVEEMARDAMAALQNSQGTFAAGAFVRGFDNISGPIDFPDPEVTAYERWQFQGDFHISTS